MLKQKNLTKIESKTSIYLRMIFILFLMSLSFTLILVSLCVFFILFKDGYYNLAEILYTLFKLNTIILFIYCMGKAIEVSVNKNAN